MTIQTWRGFLRSSDAALTVLAEGATFDALITDHAMLGMRGADLIMQARERYPAMPAMMITGYAGAEGLEALAPDVTILSKPFQREEFLNKVLSMLLGVRTSSRLQSLPTS
jgi:CheY-like chemotaxis protein